MQQKCIIIGIKCRINGRNWMTSRIMDETGKERPHMHERHTNAKNGTKKTRDLEVARTGHYSANRSSIVTTFWIDEA